VVKAAKSQKKRQLIVSRTVSTLISNPKQNAGHTQAALEARLYWHLAILSAAPAHTMI